jgi:hypothetical protein
MLVIFVCIATGIFATMRVRIAGHRVDDEKALLVTPMKQNLGSISAFILVFHIKKQMRENRLAQNELRPRLPL